VDNVYRLGSYLTANTLHLHYKYKLINFNHTRQTYTHTRTRTHAHTRPLLSLDRVRHADPLPAAPSCPDAGGPKLYRGADKSLARPGRKQATATEYFDVHISYL
jgi:hypothetical protein